MDRFKLDILVAIFLRGLGAILLFLFYQQISVKFGTNGAGVFGVIFSIQVLGVVLSNLGYNESIVKHIAKSHSINNIQITTKIIHTARIKTFPLSLLATLITLGYLLMYSENRSLPFQICFVIIPVLYIEQNAAILRGIGFFQISWILIGIAVPFLMLCILLSFNLTLLQAIICYLIFNWLVMFFSFVLLKKKIQLDDNIKVKEFIKILCNFKSYRFHLPLIISSRSLCVIGIVTAIMEIDIILINYWFGPEQTGVYSIIKKISLSISILLVAVNSVIAPKLSILFEHNKKQELINLLKKTFFILLIYAIPVTYLLISFPKEILMIFGKDFSQGSNILIIISLGQFINIITGPVGNILIMSNQEKLLRNIIVVISCLCLISYFIFIPIYGITGAAWITALRVVTQNLIVFSIVLKQSIKYGK